MNILITSAGRRVSLVKAFKNELINIFPKGKVYTADMKPELSSACQISDGYFVVVKVTDPMYCGELIKICRDNNIKLIIPTLDTELITLAENTNRFFENGIQVVISSIEMIRICRDKRKLFQYFDSIGLPRTKEIDPENTEFPIFVKPLDGSSSIGTMVIVESSQYSEKLSNNKNLIFLEYLSPLHFAEFTIDLYYDRNNTLKCAVPRERIEVRSGEVSKSVTRKDHLYDKVIKLFSQCKGFAGCVTLQVFRNRETNDIVGIEINPRFGGGYPLSYFAGANYPLYIIMEYLLYKDIQFFEGWETDLLMLRYDDEVIIHGYKS